VCPPTPVGSRTDRGAPGVSGAITTTGPGAGTPHDVSGTGAPPIVSGTDDV
jgi:hypothetical protein